MGENYISCKDALGSINISEDVVASLVRTAIEDVEGVAGLSNTVGTELAELISKKTLTKGIKVQFADDKVIVDVIITVNYGSNVVEVGKSVQEKVINAVIASTGLENAEVNVHVSGIAFDK